MATRKTSTRHRAIADPKPLPGDWLTAAEIIDLPVPAIQYKTFEQWRAGKRQGELPFPVEDHTFGSVPVWHLSRVEAWLQATGKRYDLRVWRLKLELGSYRRLGLNQNNQPLPDRRIKIPPKRSISGDWVTIPEIADLPSPPVLVTTVEVWRQRHDINSPIPFPVPDDYRGMFPVWRIGRIFSWLEAMGKDCGRELLDAKREADMYLRPSGAS